MVDFRRMEEAELAGKTVCVRVDYNVPVNAQGEVTDPTRLHASLPTLNALREAGSKIVLLSHFGRPKGESNPEFSLKFLCPVLADLIGAPVTFSALEQAPAAVKALKAGDILLLENTRFHKGETKGDPDLAKTFADLGDIFIHDAFSVAHRAHASSAGIAAFLPAFAGLAMERELDHLSQALDVPRAPVMAVVGGAKVSTKIALLKNLVQKLDILAIGGGMANTFLAANGYDVGKSLCEHELKATALEILEAAQKAKCQILLPIDVVAADEFAAHARHTVCGLNEVGADQMILDAGPETLSGLFDAIDKAKTLIWNGPLGAFEIAPFDTATVEAAQYAAKRVRLNGLIAVAGGGDTVSALNHAHAAKDFTFISTAGGAFLEWMEGKSLPGVEILK